MEIKLALDWQTVSANLRKQLSTINYNPDLKQMLDNIDKMVNELSRAEVVARQTRRTYHLESHIEKINKAINHLEKLILIAKVMD
jgi:adenine C2-methylase RlmN of 23S rRNA A2503 and tRNA A37